MSEIDPDVDAVAWDILQALHEHIPEDKRPQSWSDMDQDQEARVRAAAVAAIERMRGERDIRWAVNILLEKIAEKFDGWDTWDIWRSDAAMVVRSYKHPTDGNVSDAVHKSAVHS